MLELKFLVKGAEVNLIGENSDLTYGYNHLGTSLIELDKIIKNKGKFYKKRK